MPLPEDFLQSIKDSNEITSVMSTYVTLKRAGRDSVCLCPFHSEKTASCHVYTDTQSFFCFGCGAGRRYYLYKTDRKFGLYRKRKVSGSKSGNTHAGGSKGSDRRA